MLAQAMGLEPGAKGQEKLQKLMKQGKIGMDDLNKFIEIAKNRALSSGAYAAQLSSRTAEQTRMSNAFSLFSDSFMMQFDESLKSTFGDITGVLEKLTEWLDDQNKIQKETGEVGTFKTTMDFIVQVIKDFGSMLSLAINGLAKLSSWLGFSDTGGEIKNYLAQRQIEASYFKKMGAKTAADEWQLRMQGMPGYADYTKETFKIVNPQGTDAQYNEFLGRIGNAPLFKASDLQPGISKVDSQMAALADFFKPMTDYFEQAKSDSKAMLDAKYNTPLGNVTINIDGSKDPIATGKAVQDQLNQLLIYPR